MDAVSFLSRADSMWRSLAICAGLQCNLRHIIVWSASCYRVICVMLSRVLRQIAWYSASSQELGQQRGKLLSGREAEW